MTRIARTFAEIRARKRAGLVAYLTVGYPSVEQTLQLIPAILEGGADIIELGVPFSDPLADGATIQRSTQHALELGVSLATCVELPATLPQLVARVKAHTDLPVAVGFGVSKREHVASIGRLCEAAVVGSALVDVIESAPPDQLISCVKGYVEDITGRRELPN